MTHKLDPALEQLLAGAGGVDNDEVIDVLIAVNTVHGDIDQDFRDRGLTIRTRAGDILTGAISCEWSI